MAKNDGCFAAGAMRRLEPGQIAVRYILDHALKLEIHFPVRRTHTHTRHGIYNYAQPCVAGQPIIPMIRLIAIHMAAKFMELLATDHGLDRSGKLGCLGDAP